MLHNLPAIHPFLSEPKHVLVWRLQFAVCDVIWKEKVGPHSNKRQKKHCCPHATSLYQHYTVQRLRRQSTFSGTGWKMCHPSRLMLEGISSHERKKGWRRWLPVQWRKIFGVVTKGNVGGTLTSTMPSRWLSRHTPHSSLAGFFSRLKVFQFYSAVCEVNWISFVVREIAGNFIYNSFMGCEYLIYVTSTFQAIQKPILIHTIKVWTLSITANFAPPSYNG